MTLFSKISHYVRVTMLLRSTSTDYLVLHSPHPNHAYCMQMVNYTQRVAVIDLAYLIAMGRPNSGLKRHIQAHCHSAKNIPLCIRYRPGVRMYIYKKRGG